MSREPFYLDNLFIEPTLEQVVEAQRKEVEYAMKYVEDAKAGRLPPPCRAPTIIPPSLWKRLREKGWIDASGEWTPLGWEELWRP